MSLLKKVVFYATAQYTSPKFFSLIKEASEKWRNNYLLTYNRPNYLRRGYVTIKDNLSLDLFFDVLRDYYMDEYNDGISIEVILAAFDFLVERGLIYKSIVLNCQSLASRPQPFPEQEYLINKGLCKYLSKNKIIFNYLFVFDYIIDRYTQSVFKVEVIKDGNISLGTGWLLALKSKNKTIKLIVTNAHVLDKDVKFNIYTKNDTYVPCAYEPERLDEIEGCDIAIVKVDIKDKISPFLLSSDNITALTEVITIGYPSVPMSREAYQLIHKGEVNASIVDTSGQSLLIISARTAPGSSGSPVLDGMGRVIGMATRELFEKAAFQEKGITPYAACIPAQTIWEAIQKSQTFNNFISE